MLVILFWLCVLGIITPYVIYPVWLYLLSRLRRVGDPGTALLPVTFVVSAYNEAAVIAEKIENTLGLDYPTELLQIVVISDESDDGTDEIVSRYECVELIRQSPRAGKSAGINASFRDLRGEVIVFSDANAIYDREAVARLVRHFDDAKVGYVVCLLYTSPSPRDRG